MKAERTIQREMRQAIRQWKARQDRHAYIRPRDYDYLRGIEFALAWVLSPHAVRPTRLVSDKQKA